jgi:hypothetical protein
MVSDPLDRSDEERRLSGVEQCPEVGAGYQSDRHRENDDKGRSGQRYSAPNASLVGFFEQCRFRRGAHQHESEATTEFFLNHLWKGRRRKISSSEDRPDKSETTACDGLVSSAMIRAFQNAAMRSIARTSD